MKRKHGRIQSFFKIYQRFYKKREKSVIQQPMRKEKLRKVGMFFIYRLFYEAFENGN